MKSINRAIDRFCVKHPNFGVPNLMIYLVIGNALVFIVNMMDRTGTFLNYFYFNFDAVLRGEVWRLFTFVLVPQDTRILYEVISLYFYYWIGSTLERSWGSAKFTVFYLSAMLGTVIYGALCSLLGYNFLGWYMSASYINLSMFFIFAMMYPDMRVLLFFFIPIKIKWLAIVDAVFFGIGILTMPFPINFVPLVAVANVFIFCWPDFARMFGRKSRQERKNVTNFRNASSAAKIEMNYRGYRHKCSVCGRTDADYPNLQFRYCSRCAGYHCFCEDHINNHVHYTD